MHRRPSSFRGHCQVIGRELHVSRASRHAVPSRSHQAIARRPCCYAIGTTYIVLPAWRLSARFLTGGGRQLYLGCAGKTAVLKPRLAHARVISPRKVGKTQNDLRLGGSHVQSEERMLNSLKSLVDADIFSLLTPKRQLVGLDIGSSGIKLVQ